MSGKFSSSRLNSGILFYLDGLFEIDGTLDTYDIDLSWNNVSTSTNYHDLTDTLGNLYLAGRNRRSLFSTTDNGSISFSVKDNSNNASNFTFDFWSNHSQINLLHLDNVIINVNTGNNTNQHDEWVHYAIQYDSNIVNNGKNLNMWINGIKSSIELTQITSPFGQWTLLLPTNGSLNQIRWSWTTLYSNKHINTDHFVTKYFHNFMTDRYLHRWTLGDGESTVSNRVYRDYGLISFYSFQLEGETSDRYNFTDISSNGLINSINLDTDISNNTPNSVYGLNVQRKYQFSGLRLDKTHGWSLGFWMYADYNSVGGLLKLYDISLLEINPSRKLVVYDDSSSSNSTTVNFNIGRWTHIFYTYQNNVGKLYLDGFLACVINASITDTSQDSSGLIELNYDNQYSSGDLYIHSFSVFDNVLSNTNIERFRSPYSYNCHVVDRQLAITKTDDYLSFQNSSEAWSFQGRITPANLYYPYRVDLSNSTISTPTSMALPSVSLQRVRLINTLLDFFSSDISYYTTPFSLQLFVDHDTIRGGPGNLFSIDSSDNIYLGNVPDEPVYQCQYEASNENVHFTILVSGSVVRTFSVNNTLLEKWNHICIQQYLQNIQLYCNNTQITSDISGSSSNIGGGIQSGGSGRVFRYFSLNWYILTPNEIEWSYNFIKQHVNGELLLDTILSSSHQQSIQRIKIVENLNGNLATTNFSVEGIDILDLNGENLTYHTTFDPSGSKINDIVLDLSGDQYPAEIILYNCDGGDLAVETYNISVSDVLPTGQYQVNETLVWREILRRSTRDSFGRNHFYPSLYRHTIDRMEDITNINSIEIYPSFPVDIGSITIQATLQDDSIVNFDHATITDLSGYLVTSSTFTQPFIFHYNLVKTNQILSKDDFEISGQAVSKVSFVFDLDDQIICRGGNVLAILIEDTAIRRNSTSLTINTTDMYQIDTNRQYQIKLIISSANDLTQDFQCVVIKNNTSYLTGSLDIKNVRIYDGKRSITSSDSLTSSLVRFLHPSGQVSFETSLSIHDISNNLSSGNSGRFYYIEPKSFTSLVDSRLQTGSSISVNTPSHIALVSLSQGEMKVYLDGEYREQCNISDTRYLSIRGGTFRNMLYTNKILYRQNFYPSPRKIPFGEPGILVDTPEISTSDYFNTSNQYTRNRLFLNHNKTAVQDYDINPLQGNTLEIPFIDSQYVIGKEYTRLWNLDVSGGFTCNEHYPSRFFNPDNFITTPMETSNILEYLQGNTQEVQLPTFTISSSFDTETLPAESDDWLIGIERDSGNVEFKILQSIRDIDTTLSYLVVEMKIDNKIVGIYPDTAEILHDDSSKYWQKRGYNSRYDWCLVVLPSQEGLLVVIPRIVSLDVGNATIKFGYQEFPEKTVTINNELDSAVVDRIALLRQEIARIEELRSLVGDVEGDLLTAARDELRTLRGDSSIIIWNNYDPVSNNYRIQPIVTNNNDGLIIKSDHWTSVSEAFSLGFNTLLERETIQYYGIVQKYLVWSQTLSREILYRCLMLLENRDIDSRRNLQYGTWYHYRITKSTDSFTGQSYMSLVQNDSLYESRLVSSSYNKDALWKVNIGSMGVSGQINNLRIYSGNMAVTSSLDSRQSLETARVQLFGYETDSEVLRYDRDDNVPVTLKSGVDSERVRFNRIFTNSRDPCGNYHIINIIPCRENITVGGISVVNNLDYFNFFSLLQDGDINGDLRYPPYLPDELRTDRDVYHDPIIDDREFDIIRDLSKNMVYIKKHRLASSIQSSGIFTDDSLGNVGSRVILNLLTICPLARLEVYLGNDTFFTSRRYYPVINSFVEKNKSRRVEMFPNQSSGTSGLHRPLYDKEAVIFGRDSSSLKII